MTRSFRTALCCAVSVPQAQLELLAALGPAVAPGSLFLALRGRNLLRNPVRTEAGGGTS